jgi:chromosome segregation ATPase
MAAKKATSRARAAGATGTAGPRELKQLRTMVRDLRARLESETRKHKLDFRLLEEAKKAGARMSEHINALREQGRKLATQLQKTLGDAKSREKARAEAMTKVAELRAELRRKTEELKRKSAELVKLAKESAERARTIITEEPKVGGDEGPGPSGEAPPEAGGPPPEEPHV